MIIHLKKSTDPDIVKKITDFYKAIKFERNESFVLVTSFKHKTLEERFQPYVAEQFVFDSDIQLASIDYLNKKRTVRLGNDFIGGDTRATAMITGPCSVESEEQIEASAALLKSLGIKYLRAGSFKPRTSPYTFQGLGIDGLKLLAKMREKYGFAIVTEVRDSSHVEEVIAYADVVQIGAKAMYDQGILRKCAKANNTVLLKRGFGSSLQEFVQAAEFILSGGNENVVLCERGIRTFETKTRFTLDLCGVAYLKEYTNLPVILDPSHAMGHAYGVPDLARACMAMGVDGLLIETHPEPSKAQSDAGQQLNHDQYKTLYESLQGLAGALNIKMI